MKANKTKNIICPHCRKSVIDDSFKVGGYSPIRLVINYKSKIGIQRFCPEYANFPDLGNTDIPDREIVSMFCPHCNTRLDITEQVCKACQAPVIMLDVETGGKLAVCARKGCLHHNWVLDSKEQNVHGNHHHTF